MANKKVQITATISPGALAYLDYIASQIKPPTNRSALLDSILSREIDLDNYPIPDDIKREIHDALSKRPYQR